MYPIPYQRDPSVMFRLKYSPKANQRICSLTIVLPYQKNNYKCTDYLVQTTYSKWSQLQEDWDPVCLGFNYPQCLGILGIKPLGDIDGSFCAPMHNSLGHITNFACFGSSRASGNWYFDCSSVKQASVSELAVLRWWDKNKFLQRL